MVLKIREGSHRSTWFPRFTFKSYVCGYFTFLGDFSYEINNQEDTNKLVGLSDNWHHHKDSIRIGWRYSDGIELMADIYRNGERFIEHLMFVEADKEHSFCIEIFEDYYKISICGEHKRIRRYERTSKWKFLRYRLFPYFGGKEKAPKEFKIDLKWK